MIVISVWILVNGLSPAIIAAAFACRCSAYVIFSELGAIAP